MSNGNFALDPDNELETEPVVTANVMTVTLPSEPEPLSEDGATTVTITLPACPPSSKVFMQRHIDFHLTSKQQKAARWLYEGLHQSHAKTAAGRHVDSVTDMFRYILDTVADSIGLNKETNT